MLKYKTIFNKIEFKKIYRQISCIIAALMITSHSASAATRPYITLSDSEFTVKYERFTRYNNTIQGYDMKFSYPLAQFNAYNSFQSYRNPESLKNAGYVKSSNKYFGDVLQKNNFESIQLVNDYENSKIYIDTFLKSYGGLWRYLRIAGTGEADIDSPKIKTLAKASTQAVVGYKWIYTNGMKRRVISITFRGTEGLDDMTKIHEDWLLNALSKKIDFYGNGKVHRGYLASAKAFMEMEESVMLGDQKLSDIIDNARENHDIFVLSGHSSGGSIAAIYAAMLMDENMRGVPRDNVSIYTFGSPPFSDNTFNKIYFSNANTPRLLNLATIQERYDIVPYSNRGTKLFHYIRDIITGLVMENDTLKNSRILKWILKTESPEYIPMGYTQQYDRGEYVKDSNKEEDTLSFSEQVYFFFQEIFQKKLKHHTMSWYISILNKEAMRHNRGDIYPPTVLISQSGDKIKLFTIENSNIFYSWGNEVPRARNNISSRTPLFIDMEGSKLNFFAMDNSNNMSRIKSITIKEGLIKNGYKTGEY